MTQILEREAKGRVIRAYRHAKGMSMRELGTISLAHLSQVELGKKEISSELLAEVAKGLGIPISQILFDTAMVMQEASND